MSTKEVIDEMGRLRRLLAGRTAKSEFDPGRRNWDEFNDRLWAYLHSADFYAEFKSCDDLVDLRFERDRVGRLLVRGFDDVFGEGHWLAMLWLDGQEIVRVSPFLDVEHRLLFDWDTQPYHVGWSVVEVIEAARRDIAAVRENKEVSEQKNA